MIQIKQVIDTDSGKALADVNAGCLEACIASLDRSKEIYEMLNSLISRNPSFYGPPQFELPASVIVTTTNEFAITAYQCEDGLSAQSFHVVCPELGIDELVEAENNNARFEFTVPLGTEIGISLTFSVTAIMQDGKRSKSAIKSTLVSSAEIATPRIIVPQEGATVTLADGKIKCESSAFSANIPIEHTSSDWHLYEKSNLDVPLISDLNSSDTVSHTFSGIDVPGGTDLCVCVCHNTQIGKSEMSSMVSFKTKEIKASSSGRSAYRHESDMGSILIYNELGKEKSMFVFDASGRTLEAVMFLSIVSGLDEDIDAVAPDGVPSGTSHPAHCILPTGATSQGPSVGNDNVTENYINSRWIKGKIDSSTARYNDRFLVAAKSNAAIHAANKYKVNGYAGCIPNCQQIMRIWASQELLDSLDPTIKSYPKYSISSWCNGNNVWSSTLWKSIKNYFTVLSKQGTFMGSKQTNKCGVIPIIEEIS